ncbi:terminase [Salmonella enterica subsp. enterica serovar Eastbourne]|uniref:Terminase n=1 Tax=Salmonella enterica subsp. enterica serovar Eastbourne TaxID=486993 RepID=A0A702BDT8_SALET|nr:terminase [Salmonella enterica subsp. enterica serovar Eastbourne]ECA1898228.1 terminase [Salmonella enterica subsp. enterica serovar Eastbourne]HAC6678774.1 terminase [Salmonella enterica subsp. enterica serovar Eastbourne]HAE5116276.1 terminase [Salmonella enterica subsp. enterica serovar Eastbourne]HAE8030655.1 terminase [Salmonella enterica subsp. enterica serovar Eastbourne]
MATQAEVAEHLGITERQLRNLQKVPGSPKVRGRGDYDKDAWRYFYLSYLQRGGKVEPDEDGNDDYEEKLLIARWKLTEEQAVAQRLKNQVTEGKMIDTGFCVFFLSRLAMDLSSTLDAIPLAMQRKFPDMSPQQIAHLKTLVAKGANQCAKAGDKLPELLNEYIRTENE